MGVLLGNNTIITSTVDFGLSDSISRISGRLSIFLCSNNQRQILADESQFIGDGHFLNIAGKGSGYPLGHMFIALITNASCRHICNKTRSRHQILLIVYKKKWKVFLRYEILMN